MSVVDLERFAAIGKRHGVETLIDATLATPYNVQPIEYGIDYVLHSATKYLAGHNDLLAGVIVGQQGRRWNRSASCAASWARSTRRTTSICCSAGSRPSNCGCSGTTRTGRRSPSSWPLIRGSNGCIYPGLPTHPYYEVARRTMRGFGGLVTFLVKDADWRQTADIVDAVKLPRIGPSLGGVESLIEQPLRDELPRGLARGPRAVRHSRQHDPPVLRHRKHRGPDRRSCSQALGPSDETHR